jgi:hypothetical protein
MFKIICNSQDCANKNVIYYFTDISESTTCGGCKNELKAIKMTKTEYEKTFDYDPYKVNELDAIL